MVSQPSKEKHQQLIGWLMDGDPAIQYQVSRDLKHAGARKLITLQKRITNEGWGAEFLSHRKKDGHWGITFYQPKWTSTHYTLLDLKTIGLEKGNDAAVQSTSMVVDQREGEDGGINLAGSLRFSDVCVNGMILNYAAYFIPKHPRLRSIVDFLLKVQLEDGGWNCRYLDPKTSHSSLHSTLSVLEGLLQFRKSSKYRLHEILDSEKRAIEFLLRHKLFKSHRTGEVIDQRMLRFSFPCRWRYDVLRCLDYFQEANVGYDPRMKEALDHVIGKQRPDGKWIVQQKHPGQVHFDMEKAGAPSRWNTLRCLRVLDHFDYPRV
jgi:hypothetical protein